METQHLSVCDKHRPPAKKIYELSPAVTCILSESEKLSNDEYHALCCELIKRSPCSSDQLKKTMNLAKDMQNVKKVTIGTKVDVSKSDVVSGQHCSVDPGASSSSTLDLPSVPAAKVSMICRGDVIATQTDLFLDVEDVNVKITHEQLAGDIAIVDKQGNLLFWCYIQRDVCKYNTHLTGLTPEKNEMGLNIKMVQEILNKILNGKNVWGAAILGDLKSLNYKIDEPLPFQAYDIQDFFKDSRGQAISLGYLAEHFLGETIHEGRHSSIVDARFTAICHNKMQKLKEEGHTRFTCKAMDELRLDPKNNPKNKSKGIIRWDKCTCGSNKTGKNKKKNKSQFSGFPNLSGWDMC